MAKFHNIIGQRFGMLLIVSLAGKTKHGLSTWNCTCDCGNKHVAISGNLKSGHTKSCGCLKFQSRNKTHGMSKTPIYRMWAMMHRRCDTETVKSYVDYGGRGITVCKRWGKFENFYSDMGNRPKGQSIDRIDNSGNYCPENCRWVSRSVQNNNKRNNILLTMDGVTGTLRYWSDITGIRRSTIYNRIRVRNWSIDKSLTQPVKGQ